VREFWHGTGCSRRLALSKVPATVALGGGCAFRIHQCLIRATVQSSSAHDFADDALPEDICDGPESLPHHELVVARGDIPRFKRAIWKHGSLSKCRRSIWTYYATKCNELSRNESWWSSSGVTRTALTCKKCWSKPGYERSPATSRWRSRSVARFEVGSLWWVRDRLSEEDVQEIFWRFRAGTPKHVLATEFKISISSIKLLLRTQ